ncbi:MFS transporter [Paenibacillus alvei]|uniref:MFS transporter n=1 Tax=Paenibacillus alvei TaxID=44250 RepID=A0ABT4GVZ0_PAEAL|nr:MFS transporter [Paenibacillus alvei]MCY9544101.1 MFS transporter [Paenibacillus alvei]MCY9708619.1 MFS transporter [Paenibacillus alvei]MCY9737840.1 MFS transporter [Paenibacillus alvei]MCY9753909.1 MFS transporter [Paenibacillus alvei]MCY9760587.1 MFS transporter [Paenibacillus alvei]
MQQRLVIPRLSVMMFMQFFVWGAWYATAGLALSKYGLSSIIGTAYSVGAIASIIAPFFLGMIVDRFFASEQVMGLLHCVGGLLLWVVGKQVEAGSGTTLLWILFLYMLCYMPTLALSNNVAFHHIADAAKTFPMIRVFGTIGWIVAGILIGQLGYSDSSVIFYISAIASVLQGVFSFTLPHTPAPAKGKPLSARDLLCLDALYMLKDRSYCIFIVCSMLICIPLAAYYSFASPFLEAAGFANVGIVMTIGQMSEIAFMLLIPFFFLRFGIKVMLLVGMLAWTLRYALFAFGAPDQLAPLMIIGIALHGICYDFFFVTGFIYAEQQAGDKVKGQAQSLLLLFTQGIGIYFGSLIAGSLFNQTVTTNGAAALEQWKGFWLYPAGAALVVALLFLLLFKSKEAAPAAHQQGATLERRGTK